MAIIDDEIDRLYQGPLAAFTDARNALAKSARRPDLKQLEKPSLAAWAVNQLHWHDGARLEALAAAATALREQHRQTLAGAPADVHGAEQRHREATRECLAAAKARLTSDGHPVTPATLTAVRDTLQAVPTPEMNGRLTRPLAPRGMEALVGLVVAPRVAPASPADTADAGGRRVADDDRALAAERERRARRESADAVLLEARRTLARAEGAVAAAERALVERQADLAAARADMTQAQHRRDACG
jgi:hypothetical protein